MALETLIIALVWVLILFLVAWVLHWIIVNYAPADAQIPIKFVVGVVLLLVLLLWLLKGFPVVHIK